MTYKKVVILGAGESGIGAALLARRQGLDVMVSDANMIKPAYKQELEAAGIPFEEQGHKPDGLFGADLVIKSPGIPDNAPVVKAVSEQMPVISEIEFASWYTKAHITAITGSNGKTTTTMLTGHILQSAGLDAVVCGNVGTSFSRILSESDHAHIVLEVSSFQLDGIKNFRPDIAILLNITPDHLDRYDYRFEKYAQSKLRITMNQKEGDHLIYYYDDPETRQRVERSGTKARRMAFATDGTQFAEGGYLYGNQFVINTQQESFTMTIEELALQGKHNAANSLAAGIAARLIQIRKESLKQSLANYQNVPHRLEFVANVHGVSYINDSKATNVNSTWYALESFQRPVVWIAGGQDKGNDYSQLESLVRQRVKALICIGADNTSLIKAFGEIVPRILTADTIEQAITMASLLAEKNDVVLLSPACASFDRYQNYEERGNRFKAAVKSL
ncbi:MAG TPA: UDP-N-acetylmuramoyl-L-alanine--D-glutamate ligase [Bacteroidales bacterium]|nr:UDP-N-acetylmuramoyl-L-alanine--D-glutamate ligase [Bacteroidales bacterium]